MMASCIRIIFLITFLAAIVPTHNHFLRAKGHSKSNAHKGFGLLGCFGTFAKGVSRKCGHSFDIFTEISKYDVAKDNDQPLDVILSVAKGSGGIIDSLIDGLGSLFGNLVISSNKIIFCVLKNSHKHSKYNLCSDNDYGKRWGWKQYSGHYNDIGSVIKSYELENCQSDVEKLLNKYTKGKGLKALIGTKKLIAEAIWHIAKLFKRDYKDWCLDDSQYIFQKVVTITGALANSRRSGLGDDVVDGLIDYCHGFFNDLGYSDTSAWNENIKKELEQCDNEDFNGAINSNENNDYDSEQNNGNNNENYSNSNANESNQQSSSNQNNVANSNKNENNNSQSTNVIVNNQFYVYDGEVHDQKKTNSTSEEIKDQ